MRKCPCYIHYIFLTRLEDRAFPFFARLLRAPSARATKMRRSATPAITAKTIRSRCDCEMVATRPVAFCPRRASCTAWVTMSGAVSSVVDNDTQPAVRRSNTRLSPQGRSAARQPPVSLLQRSAPFIGSPSAHSASERHRRQARRTGGLRVTILQSHPWVQSCASTHVGSVLTVIVAPDRWHVRVAASQRMCRGHAASGPTARWHSPSRHDSCPLHALSSSHSLSLLHGEATHALRSSSQRTTREVPWPALPAHVRRMPGRFESVST